MNPYLVGILLPVLCTLLIQNSRKGRKRGLPVDVGGEQGYTIRKRGFTSPLSSAWEGVSTLAELFERACKLYPNNPLLGTRKLISRETDVGSDGMRFEKLHLGEYQWLSYKKTFEAVCNFASGLAKLGHKRGERAAIFADTREEWFIALQVIVSPVLIFFQLIQKV